tara:strand:+ start:1970 stop:3832 length:1863 start_codon:yes stop_codon:yes gene_type:complete
MCIKKVWSIVLGIYISHAALWSQTDFNKVKLYHDDIDTLVTWVENIHPLPFARISKNRWKDVVSDAKQLVAENPSDFNMILATADILNSIHDSHTSLSLSKWKRERGDVCGRNLLRFTSTKEGVFIQNDKLDLIDNGSKVIEINGKPINDILEIATRLSPLEGNSGLSQRRISEYLLIEVALANETGYQGSVEIVINDYTGFLVSVDYPLLTKKDSKKIYRKIKSPEVVEWVWIDESLDGIVRLNIHSFIDGPAFKYFWRINKGFAKLIEMEKNGEVDGFVIDLRGNWGGETSRMEYIYQYLTDSTFSVSNRLIVRQCEESKVEIKKKYRGIRKWAINRWEEKSVYLADIKRMSLLEIGGYDTIESGVEKMGEWGHYSGPTCLLIDGTSISASVAFASAFLRLDRGEIFGEECMGPMEGSFANPIPRLLPNSDVYLMISSAQYMLTEGVVLGATPIAPHRWIQNSEHDLYESFDPIIRAIEDWRDYPLVSSRHKFKEPESNTLFRELEIIYSEEPGWSGYVRKQAFEVILEADNRLAEIRRKIKEVESSSLSEEQILTSMIELNQQKKDIRSQTNSSIKLGLHRSLWTQFDKITGVNRPSVLHFGIHNRLDCNVCIPKPE